MQFDGSIELSQFRGEVKAFFESQDRSDWLGCEPDSAELLSLGRALDRELIKRGWYTMHWPQEYGGVGDALRSGVLRELEGYYRAPTYGGHGRYIVGPALLHFGTEEQKARYLPPIASGELVISEGFSEPDAGSDLAAMQTTATRAGDTYVVNGSKLYVTFGHYANSMILAARTDRDAPRHHGISLFLIDFPLPGVTISPLVCLTGHRVNEVYFDNVTIPASSLLGDENRGFSYMATALNFERSGVERPARMMADVEDIVSEAKSRGVWTEAAQARCGALVAMLEGWRLIAWRVISLQSRGDVPSWQASMSQYYRKECNPLLGELVLETFGLECLESKGSENAALGGRLEWLLRDAFNNHGQGGRLVTRNVIGRRGLGLPRPS